MPAPPKKRLAVVTCMDARIDVFRLFELEEGDAHVIRNAGAMVTDDVIRSLAISQRELGTTEVVLVKHTDCGMEGHPEGFDDLEQALRDDVERLRADSPLPHRDAIRGLIYDVETRALREVA